MHRIIRHILVIPLIVLLFSACKVNYSFTGASIPAEIENINIQYFPNNASIVNPSLSTTITQALKDKFTSETNLDLNEGEADLYLEGQIIGYNTSPLAIQTDDQAAMNRLTVRVKVTYTNTFDESKNYETTFERYADYSSDKQLDAVQDVLLEEIVELLVLDIFNKAVINW